MVGVTDKTINAKEKIYVILLKERLLEKEINMKNKNHNMTSPNPMYPPIFNDTPLSKNEKMEINILYGNFTKYPTIGQKYKGMLKT